jgi:hypothetical protein
VSEQKSVTVALIEAAAAIGSALFFAYYTDSDFHESIDAAVRLAWYRVRKARWLEWWNRQPGWRQELYERKHGRQDF